MGWQAKIGAMFACLATGACTETPYDLYAEATANEDADSATGGGATTGATTNEGGSSGTGGASPNPGSQSECQAARDATLELVRLVAVKTGTCVSQGAPTILRDKPGFEISLSSCDESASRFWSFDEEPDNSIEIRNEASNMNLDVRYADSTSGTPLVLYEPHDLYNQQYFLLEAEGDTFRISPRHAQDKCLDARGTTLEIWPCDFESAGQLFKRTPCHGAL